MTAGTQPPGPSDSLMIGNLLRFKRNPLCFLESCARLYGDVVRVTFGTRVLYLLNHPDYVDQVLSNPKTFVKSSSPRDAGGIFGNGLFTSGGEEWLKQRRLMQPAFHRLRLHEYADAMVKCAQQLADRWCEGEVRDLHHEMNLLTLRSIAWVLFGSSDDEGDLRRLETAIKVVIDRYRVEFPIPANPLLLLPRGFPIPANLHLNRAIAEIHRFAERVIARGKSNLSEDSLLSILLWANRPGHMTDELLRDQVVTMLLTGHETTACALAWTWYLLARNPAKLANLHDEIDSLPQRPLTAIDVDHLTYTSMLTLESMRLYPPSWGMNRIAIEACRIGGYEIPAGASVAMSQWVMHRDPRFFEEPQSFLPERWTGNFIASLPKGAFFPFGAGQRVCIGKDFAMIQLVLTLATIARRYDLRLVAAREVQPEVSVTLRPKNGIFATLHRR